jgi:hypothetical protein
MGEQDLSCRKSDRPLAERIARSLVYRSECWIGRQHKTHFGIITGDRAPPPFPYHWQRKNMFGCSWPRRERNAAIAWAKTALEAGYVVFYGVTAANCNGFGQDLKRGLSPDDEDEAEQWLARHPV